MEAANSPNLTLFVAISDKNWQKEENKTDIDSAETENYTMVFENHG